MPEETFSYDMAILIQLLKHINRVTREKGAYSMSNRKKDRSASAKSGQGHRGPSIHFTKFTGSVS